MRIRPPARVPPSARPSASADAVAGRHPGARRRPRRVSRPIIASASPRHGSASATPLLRAALSARLERLRAKYGIPGISASILFADGSIWRGAAGLADVAAKRKVTDDTAFPVASVSKTFTAALILDLVEDGLLDLDATVRSYLPTLGISRKITVRQLLDHTSGLRDFYFHPRIDKALLTRPARVWDAARSLTYVGKPYAKPGTSWHYSNTNYLVLGLVAEAVGGGSVAEQLRTRFLDPARSRSHVLPVRWSSRAGPLARELPLRRHRPEAAGHRPVRRHPRSRRSPRS